MIEHAVDELTPVIGTRPACRALGVVPATIYRRRRAPTVAAAAAPPATRPVPARTLSVAERDAVRAVLHSERFLDWSPAAVWAALLDEGQYLCWERTMYRILADQGEVRERRDQLVHPPYAKPELLATQPNQV